MFGVALIFIIAVMGGLIAYIGDKLGTKVGKRKLSIFGLRPKHTSILVTIITGILIAGSTLSLLALSSQNVRTALFGMEALKAELADLSQNVVLKTNELALSQEALAVKTAEYTAVNDKVVETTAKLSAVSDELSSVTAERDRTAQALSSVQQQLVEAEGNIQLSQQQIAVLEATKKQLDGKVDNLSSKIDNLTAAKDVMQKDVDRLNELTANLREGLQTVRTGTVIYRASEVLGSSTISGGLSAKETSDALATIIYHTNQDIISKLDVKDKSLEVLWISQVDFDQAVSLISSAPQEMIVRISSSGNAVYGEPVIGKLELFPNKLLYPAGSTIYSETLGATTNQQQAEDVVLDFLHHVNEAAKQQGILSDPLQGTVGAISGAQLYDAVAKVRHAGGSTLELRAVSDGSIYSAGPLKIEIQVLPVP